MKVLETVVLDLGNVLILHDNAELFRRFGERAGLCGEGVERLMSSSLWDAIHRGDWEEPGIRREVCRALGIELSDADFDELWNCHFQPNAPMISAVEKLVGRVKLVALSNTNSIHARYFTKLLPILRQFDHVLLSHQLKLLKPAPAIYRLALERAGSQPDATAFFDDVPANVEAARSLGIHGYVFESADAFISTLASLGYKVG